MENTKIKIGFTFTDRFENEYSASSNMEIFEEIGESELITIGEQFNTFLRQIGYARRNDYLLMEDLTEDELDALYDYLTVIRQESSEEDSLE